MTLNFMTMLLFSLVHVIYNRKAAHLTTVWTAWYQQWRHVPSTQTQLCTCKNYFANKINSLYTGI